MTKCCSTGTTCWPPTFPVTPLPVNEVKSTGATATDLNAKKKPKVDSSDESSSKKKKKKGLNKLNPF